MKISATSALVLNWTDPHIWKTGKAREYFNNLDLSEGDELLEQFSERENQMHFHSVSNRKYFIRKKCLEFLNINPNGQILMFAAGISPMSIEIADSFPKSIIFDIDKYLMSEKKSFINDLISNIMFIDCDISDVKTLNNKLIQNGLKSDLPVLGVFEGITYYLNRIDLLNLFKYCKSINADVIGDFGLTPEIVDKHNREFGVEVFQKIKKYVNLEFINFYTPEDFESILKESGYKNFERIKFSEIQKERTGTEVPFNYEEPGWISMFEAK